MIKPGITIINPEWGIYPASHPPKEGHVVRRIGLVHAVRLNKLSWGDVVTTRCGWHVRGITQEPTEEYPGEVNCLACLSDEEHYP